VAIAQRRRQHARWQATAGWDDGVQTDLGRRGQPRGDCGPQARVGRHQVEGVGAVADRRDRRQDHRADGRPAGRDRGDERRQLVEVGGGDDRDDRQVQARRRGQGVEAGQGVGQELGGADERREGGWRDGVERDLEPGDAGREERGQDRAAAQGRGVGLDADVGDAGGARGGHVVGQRRIEGGLAAGQEQPGAAAGRGRGDVGQDRRAIGQDRRRVRRRVAEPAALVAVPVDAQLDEARADARGQGQAARRGALARGQGAGQGPDPIGGAAVIDAVLGVVGQVERRGRGQVLPAGHRRRDRDHDPRLARSGQHQLDPGPDRARADVTHRPAVEGGDHRRGRRDGRCAGTHRARRRSQ
jgi:hypothetical protein